MAASTWNFDRFYRDHPKFAVRAAVTRPAYTAPKARRVLHR